MQQKDSRRVHFYWLDAIRFIAAFMVLLSHSRNTFFPAFGDLPANQHNIFTMAFTMFCRMGHEAVIVFFVLSGFLVGGMGLERISKGNINIKDYAISRVSRIYPPLLMSVFFYYVTSLVISGTPYSWDVAIGNIFNLQGICCKSLVSPYWSLSYEVWFYIIFGALAVSIMAKSNRGKYVGFTVFVASVSVFVLGLKMHYLLIWMMGALAYIIRPKKKSRKILIASFVCFFSMVVLYQFSKESHSLEFAIKSTNKELIELVMSLMACLFIQQAILFEPKGKVSVIAERILGKMAQFSYTLYLSHRIVFLWIIAYILPKTSCQFTLVGIANYILIIIISLVSCWLLYLISEKHSSKVKMYLKKKCIVVKSEKK